MLAAAFALLLQATATPSILDNAAEDWTCAGPLIAKNYKQPIASRQLALRIADECARPYRAGSNPTTSNVIERLRRNNHQLDVDLFVLEIDSRINQARRKDDIALAR